MYISQFLKDFEALSVNLEELSIAFIKFISSKIVTISKLNIQNIKKLNIKKLETSLIVNDVKSKIDILDLYPSEIRYLSIVLLSGYYGSADIVQTLLPLSENKYLATALLSNYHGNINALKTLENYNLASKMDKLLNKPTHTKYSLPYCIKNNYKWEKSRVYDTFTYNGEKEILDIRLSIMSSYVDYFIIVEGIISFTGSNRPLLFNINNHSKHDDKIIYIPVYDMPYPDAGGTGLAWRNEYFQRNSILSGLEYAKNNDIVIVSDVDEILDIKNKDSFIDIITKYNYVTWGVNQFQFFFDNVLCRHQTEFGECSIIDVSYTPKVLSYKIIKDEMVSLNSVRSSFWNNEKVINYNPITTSSANGWHFSYMLKNDQLLEKFKGYCHTEVTAHLEESNLLSSPNEIVKKVCSGDVESIFGKHHFAHIDFVRVDINSENRVSYSDDLRSYIIDHYDDILQDLMLHHACLQFDNIL